MRVISRTRLNEFAKRYPDAKRPLDDWFRHARKARWASHNDLKAEIRSASVVRECVVFNVGGNKFRLVTYIDYEHGIVFVKAVLTHEGYDDTTIDCRR